MQFQIDTESLRTHLTRLVGDRNPFTQRDKLDGVAQYIADYFRELKLSVELDAFEAFGQTQHNIVAHFPADGAQPVLWVGSHYDSIEGSPGADDNASGVAALLEIARLFAIEPPAAPLKLVAFTLEECDLLGSRHVAERLARAHVPIRGMISLEMLGYKSDLPNSQRLPPALASFYPHTANFIGVVGNERSRKFLQTFVAGMKVTADLPVETLIVPGNGEAIPETRLSDHSPFWDEGFCAIMLTDTSFFRNPHYHQPTDTFDTLDLKFLARNTEAAARGMDAVLKSSY